MAMAYLTVSNKAICILTGSTPIAIKIEEAAQLTNSPEEAGRKKQ